MLRMPSDLFEDNRTGVIRQMNLIDEDNLICGEDYLCPERLYPVRKMFNPIFISFMTFLIMIPYK